MNQRGARLASFYDFKISITFWKNSLIELYDYKLHDDIDSDISNISMKLERIFCNVRVMESKRRIVGVSKTSHFLLPDLIMPIDGNYTLPAFYGSNKYSSSPEGEFRTFRDIFEISLEKTEKLQLVPNDVDGIRWNTSIPKLIDNAIIGLFKCEESEVKELFNEN